MFSSRRYWEWSGKRIEAFHGLHKIREAVRPWVGTGLPGGLQKSTALDIKLQCVD